MPTPPKQGQPLTPEQEEMLKASADYWRGVGNEAAVQSLARTEDAAKQLIGLNAGLQGLYFAIVAFSNLHDHIVALSLPIAPGWLILLFCLPILFWLGSLYCATRTFIPRAHLDINLNDMSVGAWQNIKQQYSRTVLQKLRWLHRSHAFLVASFVVVLVLFVVYAFLPPVPAVGPTPVIIVPTVAR